MPKYRVHFNTVASVSITVEAEGENSAVEEAYQEIPGGICASCSGWGQDWSMDLGDWAPTDEGFTVTSTPAAEEVQ